MLLIRALSNHTELDPANGVGRRDTFLSRKASVYQALAACGACLVSYVGLLHELIGHIVFPWARGMLQGPIGWHGTALLVMLLGSCLLLGILDVIPFPVRRWAWATVVFGLGMGLIAKVVYQQLHFGTADTRCRR